MISEAISSIPLVIPWYAMRTFILSSLLSLTDLDSMIDGPFEIVSIDVFPESSVTSIFSVAPEATSCSICVNLEDSKLSDFIAIVCPNSDASNFRNQEVGKIPIIGIILTIAWINPHIHLAVILFPSIPFIWADWRIDSQLFHPV